ncbi:cylicin-1 [Grammomys surdaster]|uniref:cylicin-1 n=1 Tax=Grammomys surdaster TaxID=491861 RepID=UPI00109FAB15|nr:cylicin-1 [Grammomys surdaster]
MSLSKLDGEKLTIEDVQTSSSSCRQEINTTTCDDNILISQTRGKWNQQHFALTFPKTPMPDIKKRSGLSELEVAVPRQEKRKIEEGQKRIHVWISQFLREVFLKSSFPLAFITQAPFKYLYNPQNHYIMAETRKPKDDKSRNTLKKNFREKLSSCGINLESMRKRTNGKPEILGNSEKNTSKSSHKIKLPKKSISLSETNLESINSKKTLEMSLRNDDKNSINIIRKEINNVATCCKDKPNTDSKKSTEEHSDEISECKQISHMNLLMYLNEFRAEFTDFDEWSTNCSQNNAKKPSKKSGKKDSDIDSGDSKDAKKEGKKKDKKELKKKKDTSTDAKSVDSKDGKKKTKKDQKKESKKKKDTDSTGGESGGSKASKKDKKEKKSTVKKGTESSGSGSVDSKGAKTVKKQAKKNVTKNAFSTDSESDAGLKKDKKNEKKDNKGRRRKPVKDTESTDADSESEGDSTGKRGEKKDKKITKKGEKKDTKKNAGSSGSESDFGVKKKKNDKIKDIGSYTDSASDTSSKTGRRKISRPSDTESEESSELRVIKTTDDSDASSTDSKWGMSGRRRGFRTISKKTTFNERGKRSVTGRIPSSRERLPLPPCEPFGAPPKPRRVCRCKTPPSPPKARYAPLPGVEWIHKLL